MKEITFARIWFLVGAGDIAAAVHQYHKGEGMFMVVFAALAAVLCYVIGFSYVKGRSE
jgi:hypothetical protein